MDNSAGPVMVFGGTGHYGRKIVKSLLLQKTPVRVLSRSTSKAREILGDNVEIIEGDVTSQEVIKESLKGVQAIVISLSAMTPKLVKKMKMIERDAVLNILVEARKANILRIVYLSGYEIRRDFLEAFKKCVDMNLETLTTKNFRDCYNMNVIGFLAGVSTIANGDFDA